MNDTTVLMALVDDLAPVPDMLDTLRENGIGDGDIAILSGVPYPERVLGRPMNWERLPLISASGALVGFLTSMFLNAGTPMLYSIYVGGQPLIPLPPTAVLTFELTMMGLLVSTFLGVLWESTFPTFGPKYYDPRITDGEIGIVFRCPAHQTGEMGTALMAQGAQEVTEPEEHVL